MTAPRLLRSLNWASQPIQSARLQASRRLHTSPHLHRDLGARFRPPPPSSSPPVVAVPPPPPVPAQAGSTEPAGPRDKPVEVQGVRIPPVPIPPGDEDCCMSGCVHCVLTIYADDLEQYNSAMETARAKLEEKKIPRAEWPLVMEELDAGEEAPKMDPTIAAFAALEAKLKGKDVPPPPPKPKKPAMDPGVAAFVALEAKIRKKHQQEATA